MSVVACFLQIWRTKNAHTEPHGHTETTKQKGGGDDEKKTSVWAKGGGGGRSESGRGKEKREKNETLLSLHKKPALLLVAPSHTRHHFPAMKLALPLPAYAPICDVDTISVRPTPSSTTTRPAHAMRPRVPRRYVSPLSLHRSGV